MSDQSAPLPNTTAPTSPSSPPNAGGCRRAVGCGCQVLVVLLISLVAIWLIWGDQIFRWVGTEVVEIVADQALDELGLPEEEQAPFETILREEFSQPVLDQGIDIGQSSLALEAALSSRPAALVALRGFRARWVDRALPEAEQPAARATIAQFERGFLDGRINWQPLQQIVDIAAIKKDDPNAQVPYAARQDLSLEEIRNCIAILADACLSAEIPSDGQPIDLEAALRAEFRRQMGANQDPDQPNDATGTDGPL